MDERQIGKGGVQLLRAKATGNRLVKGSFAGGKQNGKYHKS